MPNKHVTVAYTWVSLSLWIAFPSFMTIVATISAGLIALIVTWFTYSPQLPKFTPPTRVVTQ